MKYKLLYLEDQKADTLKKELENKGYQVEVNNTEDFDQLFEIIKRDFSIFLLDYRLTSKKGKLDAPAIAQAIRTKGGKNQHSSPIVLISGESKLKEFDKDLSSQNLFDFTISKKEFRGENLSKYSIRMNSFIKAYDTIVQADFKIETTLGITQKELKKIIDYRLIEKLNRIKHLDKKNKDAFSFCRLINISLIRGIGPLIGEDVLSARLGVDKSSKDWKKLLIELENCKYNGILSESYNRWWMDKITEWWESISEGNSLRRMNPSERIKTINASLDHDLNLKSLKPLSNAKSTNFWTICKETKHALDPSEGYIIEKKDLYPWQELEYLSLNAALEQSPLIKYLSPMDRKEIRKI